MQAYGESNVYNADEFGLFPSSSPTRTIGPILLEGRKRNKGRVTFLLCLSADCRKHLPLLVVGLSLKPTCFERIEFVNLGFEHTSNSTAWMKEMDFLQWLYLLDY